MQDYFTFLHVYMLLFFLHVPRCHLSTGILLVRKEKTHISQIMISSRSEY